MVHLSFDQGTLRLTGKPKELEPVAEYLKWDDRSGDYRAEARHYGPLAITLHRLKIPFEDQAKGFANHRFEAPGEFMPRPHQQEAFQAWSQSKGRGVVVLPTGSGKTLVARLAISRIGRDTLILVPTIDLLHQWHQQLAAAFQMPIGLMGGGEHQLEPITVSTYDSALIHMERLGNRFGFLICDECHHLPALTTRLAAVMTIAPFRLGLTATPERTDGEEEALFDLLGPICFRVEIDALEGDYLAPYDLHRIPVQLDPDEREAYDAAYAQYRQFARDSGVNFSRKDGWNQFIMVCARTREGREAFAAYRMQKRLARASRAKLRQVWALLRRHQGERILLFTDDNATAYTIGETFFLPVITHKTKSPERKALMAAFRSGAISCMVNSRVLNEGVDVPEAAVGIIVSGSGSVREHVQRLGRILRPGKEKVAALYELVSEDTAETFTSDRRRQHIAYQRGEATL
ncbi:MAG: DEAD/DEAH box helicase family protein [Magnetococcales bacterium]|nr:DEAD/DEAH box helicase family protein [Magnetococcales bacterium]